MLKTKQKKYLRSLAHHLDPAIQVGKGGVNDNMIKQIVELLEIRELLKISILSNCAECSEDVAQALVKGSDAELVQIIGHTIVLYKESKENKEIILPR